MKRCRDWFTPYVLYKLLYTHFAARTTLGSPDLQAFEQFEMHLNCITYISNSQITHVCSVLVIGYICHFAHLLIK